MKMMDASAYTTYGKLCRALRGRGVKLGFYELSACAELALAAEEGDGDRVAELAERLELDLAELEAER